MRLFVFVQTSGLSKRFVALVTRIRLGARVRVHVMLERSLEQKRLAADSARELLFAIVHKLVLFEVLYSNKLPLAQVTLILTHALLFRRVAVRRQVSLQVTRLSERLVADLAHARLAVVVYAHVVAQTERMREHLVTDLAARLLVVAAMLDHVQLERLLGAVTLVADLAHVYLHAGFYMRLHVLFALFFLQKNAMTHVTLVRLSQLRQRHGVRMYRAHVFFQMALFIETQLTLVTFVHSRVIVRSVMLVQCICCFEFLIAMSTAMHGVFWEQCYKRNALIKHGVTQLTALCVRLTVTN